MTAHLQAAGVTPAAAQGVIAAVRDDPASLQGLAKALALPGPDEYQQGPLAHATWMLIADLCASLLPVIPFALLAMGPARVASVALTTLLMLVLGIWRARLGRRPTLRTVTQTVAIAAAAGAAGVVAGKVVDHWFS